jgi:glyceraldehyde 3-phosphate dehydrogenase
MADFTIQLQQESSRQEINRLFATAAKNDYKSILDYTEDELVSLDIKGNTHSCVIDGSLTSVVGNHLKLIAWFDNEYGFTTRMIDWLVLMK